MEKQNKTISINGELYVRADSIEPDTSCIGDIKIVVADRGFVYIGIVEEIEGFIRMTNAYNIRVWGTTRGLGELVHGPKPNTKLDSVGSLKIPNRAVLSNIDVEQSEWNSL